MSAAPKGGYDFGAKRAYRRNVWSAAKSLLGADMRNAQVLLMPGKEGDEIDVAIKKGASEHCLHLVDGTPRYGSAWVATHKRDYPKATCYGVRVEQAVGRIAKQGNRLSFANFDFTSHADGVARAMSEIGSVDVFTDPSCVAVTMLRGREQSDGVLSAEMTDSFPSKVGFFSGRSASTTEGEAMDAALAELEAVNVGNYDLTENDARRVYSAIYSLLDARSAHGHGEWRFFLSRVGSYRSNTQTMLWFVASIFSAEWDDRLSETVARNIPTQWGGRLDKMGDHLDRRVPEARWIGGGQTLVAMLRSLTLKQSVLNSR